MNQCVMPGVAGNPALFTAMSNEVADVLKLVPDSSATLFAIDSGNWSDSSIWSGARVPTGMDNVVIGVNFTVTIDDTTATAHWVRVDGKLVFSTASDSALAVDTLIVMASGDLEMVSTDPTIHTGITFTDAGPIDRTWDPKGLSRQLIALGTMDSTGLMTAAAIVNIQGAQKDGWKSIAGVKAGATSLGFGTAPNGWRIGDQILFNGTGGSSGDDVVAITGITGSSITFAPLPHDHLPPTGQLTTIANLTRNVVLKSANTSADPQRNGCTMFMHTMEEVQIGYASFINCGRTDKSLPLNNPVLDSNGKLVPGTGSNVVGRYAVHFHRNYNFDLDCIANVTGCVVQAGPGWGYDNHSSNVNFTNNIAYLVYGAGFAAEAGNEQGKFWHNLVVNSQLSRIHPNPGSEQGSNGGTANFGFAGLGFWFQGTEGISVRDNYVAEVNDAAFVFYGRPLDQGVFPSGVWNANVVEQKYVVHGTTYTQCDHLPFRDFVGNTAAVANKFLECPWLMNGRPSDFYIAADQNNVDNCVGWELKTYGVRIDYASEIHLHNCTFLASANAPPTSWPTPTIETGSWGVMGIEAYAKNITAADCTIIGFGGGIYIPRKGGNNGLFGKSYLDNQMVNAHLGTYPEKSHFITIQGDVQFGTQHATPGKHVDWFMEPIQDGDGKLQIQSIGNGKLTPQNAMLLDVVQYPKSAIYLQTQAYSYNPFVLDNWVQPQLDCLSTGLKAMTNGQMQAKYGRAYGGASAPIDAVPLPNSNNLLVGKQQPQKPAWVLPAELYSPWGGKSNTPTFIPKVPGLPNFPAVTLPEGWSFVPETVGGLLWSCPCFLDTQPPWWTLSPTQPTTASLAIPPTSFKVSYTYFDNTFPPPGIAKSQNVNLAILPIQTAPDGSKFVVVSFFISDYNGNVSDYAGNKVALTFNVTLQ